MKTVDLSHSIHPGMPVYPGSEAPVFSHPCSIDKDGFAESRIAINSHTGTHIDAPAHIFASGTPLDALPFESFSGSAVVVDCTTSNGPQIDITLLAPCEKQLEQVDFLLLHTGWDTFWPTPAYFTGYPVLTVDAARWLHRFALKGVGVDTISVDAPESSELPIHHTLLGAGTLIIENLTRLELLHQGIWTFYCPPLPIRHADGAPVRAFAVSTTTAALDSGQRAG